MLNDASNVGGVSDKGVNSSIGSQWRCRIDAVDEQIPKMAEDMYEAERNSTYLNVNLIMEEIEMMQNIIEKGVAMKQELVS